MKIEELRKIADTAPANLCIQVCRRHFEALIAVAECAEALYDFTSRDYDEKREPLYQALKKLKEIGGHD